ncbi:MAG: glycosyltransferase [Limnochordia bacterium]|jgi:glycosyltransferase involved in cell wall biosynthesis
MKNVALIVYSLEGGGAERVTSTLSQELAKRHNLYVVVFSSDDIAYDFGGELIDLNLKSRPSLPGKLFNLLLRTLSLRRVKKKLKLDCSISLMESANLPNVLSRRKERVIISFHSSRLARRLWDPSRKADWIVGVSKDLSKKLIEDLDMPVAKVRTIYNPIDVDYLQSCSVTESGHLSALGTGGEGLVIATMGRLTHAKGHWHLIRAMTRVKEAIPDVVLSIFGEGELRSYLSKLIEQLQLEDTVHLFGYQSNPFMYVKNAGIFVLPSLYEGFSMVLCEAMALGVPVIDTHCKSGPREILDPNGRFDGPLDSMEFAEYGLLIPTCDGTRYDASQALTKEETILAESVIELASNAVLRQEYSERGKMRASHFDVKHIAKKWEALMEADPPSGVFIV